MLSLFLLSGCNRGKEEVVFYENGQVYKEKSYGNNEGDSAIVYYYPNGNIFFKGEFVNGKRHGVFFQYYMNGNVKWEGHFKHGMNHGFSIRYYENGRIERSANFLNNELDGQLVVFSAKGDTIFHVFYKEGRRVED